MPISLFAIILILNNAPEHKEIYKLTQKRHECLDLCTDDNFPSLTCKSTKRKIEYQGNEYENFFEYPNPNQLLHNEINEDYSTLAQKNYDKCKDVIIQYKDEKVYKKVGIEETVRRWKVHSCFEPCRNDGKLAEGFTVDNRPLCKDLQNTTPCLK